MPDSGAAPAHQESGGRLAALALAGILLLASGVRLYHLGRESIWLDEASSIRKASRGLAYTIEVRRKTWHPPLYEAALGAWIAVAGDREFAVRLPSAVLGVLACGLLYLLGSEMADRRVGLTASLLMGLSWFPIVYSQEARMYSMLLALTVASVLLMWRALRGGRAWVWVALGLVNVLLAYTHLFGLLMIGVENVWFLAAWPRARRRGKAWLAVQAAVAAALVPWAAALQPMVLEVGSRVSWLPQPGLLDVLETLQAFLPLNPAQAGAAWVSLAYAVLAGLGLAWLARNRPERRAVGGPSPARGPFVRGAGTPRPQAAPGLARAWLLLPLWLLLPFAVTVATSRLILPCYVPRCLIVAAPAASLLVAMGLRSLGRRLGAVLLVGGCAFAGAGLWGYYRTPQKEGWRQIVKHIDGHRENGDCVVLCASYCVYPFNYYCRVRQRSLPRYGVERTAEAGEVEASLPGRLAGHRRVWLVLAHTLAEREDVAVWRVLTQAPWARRVGRGPEVPDVEAWLFELSLPAPAAESSPEGGSG